MYVCMCVETLVLIRNKGQIVNIKVTNILFEKKTRFNCCFDKIDIRLSRRLITAFISRGFDYHANHVYKTSTCAEDCV